MKSVGIVRKVDEFGRVVIPVELRRLLDIDIKDPVEIFVDGEQIVLKKHQLSCVFCNNRASGEFRGKYVCEVCKQELCQSL